MKIFKIEDNKFCRDIYNLNNSLSVRKYSINKKKFSYKSHLKWFKQLLNSNKLKGYIILKNNVKIGFIKTVKKKNSLEVSWSVFKSMRSKGYGKKILLEFTKKFPEKYTAQILENNLRSIQVCNYSNFKPYFKKKNILYFKNF